MKLSIITKTFRIHDNPFLDSDLYVIYINQNEYGFNQLPFLNRVLDLHLKDLNNLGIFPIIIDNLKIITSFIKKNKQKFDIHIDHVNADVKIPFKKYTYYPTWCLIDWTDKVEKIQQWFLPEGLKNHKVFKEFVHKNIRNEYDYPQNIEGTKNFDNLDSNYHYDLEETSVPLPDENLDSWILDKLKNTSFMNKDKWFKPDTSPSTSIIDDSDYLPDKYNTSKLSPYIALGVISPLVCYNFYNDENRMGSGRDQFLFREMFHSCSQIPEFWDDNFGKEYDWKSKNKKKWDNFINGTTGHVDVDRSMRQLKKEGWIHHLARHIVADYLTRGKLDIHWKHGMEWFRQTLVDHDKCVNRANWMWLSGTAFSTKQRSFYHYNYDKYIQNKDKKLKVVTENPNFMD